MNARRDLYAALMAGGPHSPERSEKASALIDAFLAEAQSDHARLAARAEELAFLERNTLPEMQRTIQHHKDGKQRWRKRAEEAEARVRELERPAVEAKRNEIRDSYAELIAAAEETKDYEGAFDVQCRLRDREDEWAREDAAATAQPEPTPKEGQ